MINVSKIRFDTIKPINRISLDSSDLELFAEKTIPRDPRYFNGDPKYFQGLLQVRDINIDDPYDSLSKKDRGILLNLRALERKHSRFQPFGANTREKVLDILKEVDPIIQKADKEFAVAVINERVLVMGCGEKDRFYPSDSFLIKLSFYPNLEINENFFTALTHNHPNVFLQELSSSVSAPLSLADLILFSNSPIFPINIIRAVDYGGDLFTVETSLNTKKELLADHLNDLRENMDQGLISDIQKLVNSGTLSPELRSSRDRVLKYLKDFEEVLPEMAQKFDFTYSKTFLNQDDEQLLKPY